MEKEQKGGQMRELKFRAWDKTNGYYLHNFMDNFKMSALNSELFIVEQFTGLHDKIGKEIYEGDIIRWSGGDIGFVYWDDIDMKFNIKNTISHWQLDNDGMLISIEIIGNIHEDPELMEGK
jgi:uncharacterized phage protein (TIGR01671 family)